MFELTNKVAVITGAGQSYPIDGGVLVT